MPSPRAQTRSSTLHKKTPQNCHSMHSLNESHIQQTKPKKFQAKEITTANGSDRGKKHRAIMIKIQDNTENINNCTKKSAF